MRPLTPYMKTILLDLYAVVLEYDGGKPMLPHDVDGVHHKILKGLADDSRKLIILEASNSPLGIVWTVALTPKGLREAKKLAKLPNGINAQDIKPTRKRKTIQVQLHEVKQAEVIEAIATMKRTKGQSYTRFVVQSVEMDRELKAGEFGLFKQLYPEAYANILMSEMLQEWKRFADTPRNVVNAPVSGLQPIQGLRPIAGNVAAPMPVFDDNEDLDLSITKDTSNTANTNFLKSVFSLQD